MDKRAEDIYLDRGCEVLPLFKKSASINLLAVTSPKRYQSSNLHYYAWKTLSDQLHNNLEHC